MIDGTCNLDSWYMSMIIYVYQYSYYSKFAICLINILGCKIIYHTRKHSNMQSAVKHASATHVTLNLIIVTLLEMKDKIIKGQ